MENVEQDQGHLASGNLEGAISAFQAVAHDQASPEAWADLGVSLARARRWDEFLRLVESKDPQITFFNNICVKLRWDREFKVLGEMHRALPENHIVIPLAHYYAGVELITERRYIEALEHFHRFKLLTLHNFEIFQPMLTRQNYHLVFRQGTLVEPLPYVAALEDGSLPVEEHDPRITVRQQAASGRSPVLFACGLNDLYFHRFAESLIATLAESCGEIDLHFHVVGKQKDCWPLFQALEQRYPKVSLGLSLDPAPLACHAPYYACDRFVVMPQLLDLYGRDIMTLDADGLVLRDLTELHRRLKADDPKPDFACFNTGRTEPASVYQATLMYFANTPGCRNFVRLLRRFIFSKLSRPPEISWLTDQSSLFSVSTYLEQKEGSDFVFRRLDELAGESLADYVDSAGTEEEKQVLVNAGFLRSP